MASNRAKGTTLIELIVTTAVVAVIMSAVLLIWRGNTLSAQQCRGNVSAVTEAENLINTLARSIENLIEENDTPPLQVEHHSNKVFIKMFTRYNFTGDSEHPLGPFITEYELDKEKGLLKYRQRAVLDIESEFGEDSIEWQTEKTDISDITIEKVDKNELYPVCIRVEQENARKNRKYSLTVSR